MVIKFDSLVLIILSLRGFFQSLKHLLKLDILLPSHHPFHSYYLVDLSLFLWHDRGFSHDFLELFNFGNFFILSFFHAVVNLLFFIRLRLLCVFFFWGSDIGWTGNGRTQ